MLQGLNFEASRKLAHATRIPVILSGGLTSIDEIQDLNKSENMIFKGAIMGKALYEKKIDPLEALKTLNR
jgi:phosphoribosylformimino-5-aminoimidazole carboxamide ribotide isomerase